MTLAGSQILAYSRSKGWPDPVQEHVFHPDRKWRFDFAWPSPSGVGGVAVEVHGAVHQHGRHTRGKGFETDREKMNEAAAMGWCVFEVTYRHLAKGMLFAWLDKAMEPAFVPAWDGDYEDA